MVVHASNGRHAEEIDRDIAFATEAARAAIVKTAATSADIARLEGMMLRRFAHMEAMIIGLAVLAGVNVVMLIALLLRR